MLIQFSVRNFKTFLERSVISFVASNYDKTIREEDNVKEFTDFNLRILKSAVLFGANASGKSKYLDALLFMAQFVRKSSKESLKDERIGVDPFRLNTSSVEDTSEFEVVFIHKNEIYRYGFEVDEYKIHSEWLYHKPKTKEIEIFYRQQQSFENHSRSFSKGKTLVKENFIRNNALMVSVAAQFNDKLSGLVLEWFSGIRGLSGLQEESYTGFTMGLTKNPLMKEKILAMMRSADLGIKDIELEHVSIEDLPEDMPRKLRDKMINNIKTGDSEYYSDALTSHGVYNNLGIQVGEIQFSLDEEESSGTKKFFALTGPIMDVLENGYILVVDELDSKLHPKMVCAIVELFNSKTINTKNAQLVFNTHDTNLLSSQLFRRDQIWFTKKDRYGSARIYSLLDLKADVRGNENFEDNYIKGKYGAVPYLDAFEKIFTKNLDEKEG